MSGPISYKSNKSIPWNYGGEIFYHGVKQVESTEESSDEETSDIGNIAKTSKITCSGRIFSSNIVPPREIFGPSIAPKVTLVPVNISMRTPMIEEIVTPIVVPSTVAADKGKGIQEVPVRTRAQPLVIHETTQKEMEEILKIIKKSVIMLLSNWGKTPQRFLY